MALTGVRVLLFPLHLTSEYLLRQPLGAAVSAAERVELPRKLYDFFAFGPDHKLGFVPVAFIEFGFRPSVGIYAFWNDAFFLRNNELRLHYEVWPDEWFAGSVQERIHVGDHVLQLRVSGLQRPDQVFYGLGPSSRQSSQSRYTVGRFEGSAMLDAALFRGGRLRGTVGLRKVDVSAGHESGDPTLEEEARTGAFPVPYGYNHYYVAPYARLHALFDTRESTTQGSGLRAELYAEPAADVHGASTPSWIRWGATASGLLDVNGHGRVLGLTGAVLFADPIAPGPIPFTELAALGGDLWMHGYFAGRLVGRSAAVAELKYDWPVAPWLGATLQATFGNVFGEHLTGYRPSLLRLSGALGLATNTDPPLELLLGFGTDTFERGGSVDSVRVSLGVPHSF